MCVQHASATRCKTSILIYAGLMRGGQYDSSRVLVNEFVETLKLWEKITSYNLCLASAAFKKQPRHCVACNTRSQLFTELDDNSEALDFTDMLWRAKPRTLHRTSMFQSELRAKTSMVENFVNASRLPANFSTRNQFVVFRDSVPNRSLWRSYF